MTTIVTLKSGAYAIYDTEGIKIVQCNEPINTFNEVVKNIGIDTENVQIIDDETFPDVFCDKYITTTVTENGQTNLDNVINIVNASISGHDREMKMYEDAGILDSVLEIDTNAGNVYVSVPKEQSTKEPVGNIEIPLIGDLVYVEGVRGVLRIITGGVGTVAMINDDNSLIELEEIPGQYFSWDDLKCEQDELKSKYGYKPASMF